MIRFVFIEIPVDFGKGSNLEKRGYHYQWKLAILKKQTMCTLINGADLNEQNAQSTLWTTSGLHKSS